MDYVDFGSTDLKVSRLSIGTGTHGWGGQSAQTKLGWDGLANLLHRGYKAGVTFWDAADQYGSHAYVARALQRVPRDQVVVTTKTTAKTELGVKKDVRRFLNELNTDVLDIVLLHGLSSERWPKRYAGAMHALSRAKADGLARAVGVSCHGLGALRAAANTDWVDVVLVRINHAGVNMDGSVAEVVPLIEKLYASGKAVYAMKVLGCGKLTDDVHGAIEYVLSLGMVHALTIGATSVEQLEENVKLVEELAPQYPLK